MTSACGNGGIQGTRQLNETLLKSKPIGLSPVWALGFQFLDYLLDTPGYHNGRLWVHEPVEGYSVGGEQVLYRGTSCMKPAVGVGLVHCPVPLPGIGPVDNPNLRMSSRNVTVFTHTPAKKSSPQKDCSRSSDVGRDEEDAG